MRGSYLASSALGGVSYKDVMSDVSDDKSKDESDDKSRDESNDKSEDESGEDEIEQIARSSDKGKGVFKEEDRKESMDDDDPVSITVPGFTWRRGMASIANVDTDDG